MHVIFHALCARQPDNGLNDGKRVARPMVDFPRQQHLALVGFFAIGNIDGDAVDTDDLAGIVEAGSGRSDTPSNFATRPHYAEFGLLGAGALRHASGNPNERDPVFRMDQRPDVLDRDFETTLVYPEYAVLALVPTPLFADQVPIPRAHLTGGKREAATLLRLFELHVRSFKLGRALCHVAFKLQVHSLKFAGLAEQLGEYPHFRAQDFGNDRHRDIVDRAHLVTAQPIDIGQVNGGYENDRRFAKARMLADHRGQLETVEFRHTDVDQNHGDVILEQKLQRLARRRSLDQVHPKLTENDVVSQKFVRLIVDKKDVDFFGHVGA